MGMVDTIKTVIVVFAALIIAVVVSIKLTGSPGAGITLLAVYFVAQATREKMQNKKQEKE